MTGLCEGLHANWPERRDSVRLGTVDRETSEDTPTTLMSRRFMSCWSAERKPWLILGKTIWAGVWGQEVVGQRWEKSWARMRSQKKRKKQRGRGRQMQKETDFVRKAYVHEPRSGAFTDEGEKSTLFPAPFDLEVWAWFFFLELGLIITTSGGATAPQWVRSAWGKKKRELLHVCESTVIIIMPAAKSNPESCTHWNHHDWPSKMRFHLLTFFLSLHASLHQCPLVLSDFIHRWNNPQGQIGGLKDLWWTIGKGF